MALIFEDSKEVRSKSIPIPKNTTQVFKAIAQVMEPYLDTVEGGKVLKSYASDKTYNKKGKGANKANGKENSDKRISIDVAKMRLSRQNKFSPNSVQYQLYGGQTAHNLLKKGIEQARAVSKVPAVKPPKPTAVDVKPPKTKELKPIETPNGQVTIKESSDSHQYYDYILEYDVNYVVDDFFRSIKQGIKRQNWLPLIRVAPYTKALREFTRYGKFITFPGDMVYRWMGIIMRNTAQLRADTSIYGHVQTPDEYTIMTQLNDYLGYDKAVDEDYDTVTLILSEKDLNSILENNNYNLLKEDTGVHRNGQYDLFLNQDETDEYDEKKLAIDKFNNKLEIYNQNKNIFDKWAKNNFCTISVNNDIHDLVVVAGKYEVLSWLGFEEWAVAPDESTALSDYGLDPIEKIIFEYREDMEPEEVLVLVNRVLDCYHMRGDLSSYFIEGGKASLSQISEEVVKKTVIISESQIRLLKEYYGQQMFNFDDQGEPYYEKDAYQLYIDFLESIGKYGQLSPESTTRIDIENRYEETFSKAINDMGVDSDEDDDNAINALFVQKAINSGNLSEYLAPVTIAELNEFFNDEIEDNFDKLMEFCDEIGFSTGHVNRSAMDSYKQVMMDYYKDRNQSYEFPKSIKLNDRGLIIVEREITIPPLQQHGKFTYEAVPFGDFYQYLKKMYQGVGQYWSFGRGEAYCGNYYNTTMHGELLLKGCVSLKDVDFSETTLKNIIFPDEREIYIPDGHVEIDQIIITRGWMNGEACENFNILKQPIIVPTYCN